MSFALVLQLLKATLGFLVAHLRLQKAWDAVPAQAARAAQAAETIAHGKEHSRLQNTIDLHAKIYVYVCMYVCMYIYIYVYIYTYTYKHYITLH